jgi:pimeloyl-ACP methyl ester carboxylesterase
MNTPHTRIGLARRLALRAVIALAAASTLACAPREILLPAVGIDPPELADFPTDFERPLSAETGRPMPGFGGGEGALSRTPVIFIHGNTVSARYWLPVRSYFAAEGGYGGNELWALGYGWDNVRYFDSGDLSVPSVERIVNSVTEYLERTTGKPVPQVDVIGHSLGVTLVRQWMKQTNSWHRVRSFIGACGANQGVWTAWPDSRGQNRVVSFELYPGSPWLEQLNRGGETPGPTRYMTLYDGNGWSDVLFPAPFEHSSALKGAFNLPINLERGTYYDHLALPREPASMDAMLKFLRSAPDALPGEAPRIVRQGNLLRAEGPDATLHCATGDQYPSASTRGVTETQLNADTLYTCFALDARSRLSSPMARFKAQDGAADSPPPTLTANVTSGVYEQPQQVTLQSSDPQAFIVYTTSGTLPNSGSPLYTEPVYVPGPLTLQAVAITPDGRQSEVLKLELDISLELVEAQHTLERQFDHTVPPKYRGQRKKGR